MKFKVKGELPGTMSPEEVKKFIKWARDLYPEVTFDENLIGFPRCVIYVAQDSEGVLAFCPMQTTLMAECFIPRPETSNFRKAAALGKFDEVLCDIGRRMSIAQIYTYVPVSKQEYIEKVLSHGWEEVEGVRIFKKNTGLKEQDRG